MCSKLGQSGSLCKNTIILLCCVVAIGRADMAFSKEPSFLLSANGKEEILKGAKKEHGRVWSEHLNVDGKEILIVSVNIGSGVARVKFKLYLFSETRKQWELLLLRVTNTSKVIVDYNKRIKEVNIYSKAGKKLVSLPIESLNLNYDRAEQ